MNVNETNLEEKRLADMLHAAWAQAPPPDEGLLRQLAAESTQAFLAAEAAAPAHRSGKAMRTIKWFASAAACLAAAVAIWWLVSGPPLVESAHAQLAAAIDNSKGAEWVHIRATQSGELKQEGWFSFQPFRCFGRVGQRVYFADGTAEREYQYDPAAGTVTILPLSRDFVHMREKRSFLEAILAKIDRVVANEEGELTRREESVGGKTYIVFDLTLNGDTGKHRRVIRVDPEANRVLSIQTQADEQPEAAVWELDYPRTGPADIYALGVPKAAEIVNEMPTENVGELDRKVQAAREGFADTYHAIICKARIDRHGKEESLVPVILNVVYKKNGKYRVEGYAPHGMPRNVSIADGKALEAWIARQPLGSVRFILGTRRVTMVHLGKNREVVRRRDRGPMGEDTVEGLSWGPPGFTTVGATVSPAEDEAGNQLLAREHCWEGKPVVRQHYDPQRDLLRMRYENLTGAAGTETVEECARTPHGQWYAKKILRLYDKGDAAKLRFVTLIHLDTTRDIPDEMFDPDQVTRELFLPRRPADRQE